MLVLAMENMNQDKAIFISQCSAFPYENNEILIHILPLKSVFCLFLISGVQIYK
jgi:hypothetical protein